MPNWISTIFRKQSPVMMATVELEEAQRGLLEAQTATEWARSMVSYQEQRIKRLTIFLRTAHDEKEEQLQ
jgi:hypothetical protein